MYGEIVRAVVEGAHLAIYSSIKPGAVHRLRLDQDATYMMSSCISIINHIMKAIEVGESVRKGGLAATGVNLGGLYAKALREAYRWIGRNVYPDIIIPSITNALILSYVEPESVIEESGNLRRALNIFVGGSRWRDVRELMNALRSIGDEEKVTHLQDIGIGFSQALTEGASLIDAFNALASKWPGFIAVNPREDTLFEYVKKLMSYYRKYRDSNNAIVRLYIDIINPKLPQWARENLAKAVEHDLMMSREGSKILFETDIKLRKQGISFNNYVPLLVAVVQLAVYEGLRPM